MQQQQSTDDGYWFFSPLFTLLLLLLLLLLLVVVVVVVAGYTSLDEIIGRAGLLTAREDLKLKKARAVDVSFVLDALKAEDDRSWLRHGPVFSNGRTFDDIILEDEEVRVGHHRSSLKCCRSR